MKLGEDRHTVRFGMLNSRSRDAIHHQRPAGVSARDAGVLGVSADRLCSVVLRPPGLRQSDCLEATYGPQRFLRPLWADNRRQRHPNSAISYTGHECQWNGPSWPYSTAVTLTAMANLLNDYRQDAVGRKDYLATLKIYAKSHHLTRRTAPLSPGSMRTSILSPATGLPARCCGSAASSPRNAEGLQPLDVLRTGHLRPSRTAAAGGRHGRGQSARAGRRLGLFLSGQCALSRADPHDPLRQDGRTLWPWQGPPRVRRRRAYRRQPVATAHHGNTCTRRPDTCASEACTRSR